MAASREGCILPELEVNEVRLLPEVMTQAATTPSIQEIDIYDESAMYAAVDTACSRTCLRRTALNRITDLVEAAAVLGIGMGKLNNKYIRKLNGLGDDDAGAAYDPMRDRVGKLTSDHSCE